MKVLNLRCAHDHSFEGWFGSEADYQSQCERGLVECPLCGDKSINKLPTAPRLNVSKALPPSSDRASAGPASESKSEAITMQVVWNRAVQHILANTEDVGERFAEEARRIHYGEIKERAIRGQATAQDTAALKEEGIEVMPLPVPAALKGPVQ